MGPGPILICYDGSADAERGIDAAAALLGPREAIVLTVAPAMTVAESVAATSPGVRGKAFEDVNEAGALERARPGAEYARRAGFHAEPHSAVAPTTWEGIVDVANGLDAAVIVIGSRGLSGPPELVRGSVSHDVAVHAGRPVLIVPPPAL